MKPIYKQIASAVLLLVVGILGGNVAPPILPKPAPEPSPAVRVKPVQCIVTKDGKRIESQPISDIAANEADGVHEVLCIPPLGNPIVRRTITVATEGAPVPQPPVEPKPVSPAAPANPVNPSPAKQVTYVYEKDDGEVPSGVRVALDKLSRQGILATAFEDDTTDGDDDVPAQYAVALKAAKERGGQAALVVQVGSVVQSVWHNVETEKDVMEAVK